MCQSKKQCIILYCPKYKKWKSQLKNLFMEMKFSVKCQIITTSSKEKIKTKVNNIRRGIPNKCRCLILFYLNDSLTADDTNLVEIFSNLSCKSLLGNPKCFIFYGASSSSTDDRNNSKFFLPEEPDIFYAYCKKTTESDFNYMESFVNSVKNDNSISIINIHQNIIQKSTQYENAFSDMHYFCSMGKHFIPNRQGILDYLCIGNPNTKNSQTENIEIDDEEPGISYQYDREEPETTNPDELKSEFGNIEDCMKTFSSWKNNEAKTKRFVYYVITSGLDNVKNPEQNKSYMEILKLALKNTYSADESNGYLYNFIIDKVTVILHNYTSVSMEYLLLLLDLVNWCIQNYRTNGEIKIDLSMDKFLNTAYDFVTSIFKSATSSSGISNAIISMLLTILYSYFSLNKYLKPISIVIKLAWYIYQNWDTKKNKLDYPIFSYLGIESVLKGVCNIGLSAFNYFTNNALYSTEDQNAMKSYSRKSTKRFVKDLCIIISDSSNSQKDIDSIKKYFSQKYAIQELENKSSKIIFAEILGLKKSIKNSSSKILIFILTSGNTETMKMQDGNSVNKSDLLNHFSSTNCDILQGKPKLCFLQTVIKNKVNKGNQSGPKFDRSDFFIGYGNLEENNLESPSYIQTLIDVLKSNVNQNVYEVGLKLNNKFNSSFKNKSKNYIQNASFEYSISEKNTFIIDKGQRH